MLRHRTEVSGSVYLHKGKRTATWRARLYLPTGETRRTIGPAWTGRGRPPAGTFTKRSAEAWLHDHLASIRNGTAPGLVRTGVTFGDACDEWLRHAEHERGCRPSTMRDYRSSIRTHLRPAFGTEPVESITTRDIEAWRSRKLKEGMTRRTATKQLMILHGVYERARRVWGLPLNPAADVERLPDKYDGSKYDFYEPEDVHALVRELEHPTPDEDGNVPDASPQDAAIVTVAAFAGLRLGEILALRVRDVDFSADSLRVMQSLDHGTRDIGPTKSGHGRSVPMVPEVAQTLARILSRDDFAEPDDLVFPNPVGHPIDGSALRRRYKNAQTRAKLRPLRFHDLRHTFGSLASRVAMTREVQAWLGHADARTTQRYSHHRPQTDDAAKLARAFTDAAPDEAEEIAAT